MAAFVGGVELRQRRRWTFADCLFDEANWSLTVAGRRVPVEIKPLELLRALLLRAGNVVSKEELLDTVWPNVEVVEASLTTAIRKLRSALRQDRRRSPIIQTVPRIGYRLAVPVTVEELAEAPEPLITAVERGRSREVEPQPDGEVEAPNRRASGPNAPNRMPMLMTLAGGLAIGAAAVAVALGPAKQDAAAQAPHAYSQREAADAIRELDNDAIKHMLAAGWDPSTPWDKDGNDALNILLNRCEWDPGHDRREMLLAARMLIEGGAPIDRRNVWGDTAYSISKAQRYCGPDHPITQMLEAMCYGGSMSPKDRCLATYELTAEQRRAQGLPPQNS